MVNGKGGDDDGCEADGGDDVECDDEWLMKMVKDDGKDDGKDDDDGGHNGDDSDEDNIIYYNGFTD